MKIWGRGSKRGGMLVKLWSRNTTGHAARRAG